MYIYMSSSSKGINILIGFNSKDKAISKVSKNSLSPGSFNMIYVCLYIYTYMYIYIYMYVYMYVIFIEWYKYTNWL
jgi:hypothetical protein